MARFAASFAVVLGAACLAAGERDVRQAEATTVSLFGIDESIAALEGTKARKAVSTDFEDLGSQLRSIDHTLGGKIADTLAEMSNKQLDVKADLEGELGDAEDKMAKQIERIESELAALKGGLAEEVTEKLEKLQEFVDGKLGAYQEKQTWSNYTFDPKYDERNYELLQIARSPDNTENGHAGRIMYKVKFNVNNPGFWYPDRNEMFHACRSLSKDLADYDGIDRSLKPACDTDWACDSNGVRLAGSYLSHCGSGGHRRTAHCVGMSDYFLGGSCMYNRHHSWSGCRMLRHDGRPNHHHWADCYARSGVQCEHTICTAANGNSNWKVPPNGWCDPKDDLKCYNF
jgi:hypothetical protein